MAAIEKLLEPDTAGDPISDLRWTHRTTAKIAVQLLRLGIRVSTRTVARWLHKLRFSLHVNRKKVGILYAMPSSRTSAGSGDDSVGAVIQ